ncbi:TetR/AcrR family transcriptional regulator [Sagittula sp.]|uniref:TetR/AcrR family transcriptional regulator n=1 Tax=Sagittula sp. TaxID=2038081 RepID=UPI003516E536
MSSKDDKTRHHHGNLKPALVEAGIALLEEGGLEALSLRKCAARAGVSHAAPAHHFGNAEGLRRAIADEGFARFEKAMLRHAEAAPQTPRDRLRGIARGYLAFARSEPALYDLIFSFREASPFTEQERGASAAYRVLRDTCAPLVPPGTDPLVIETQVWALVHGFILLEMTGRIGNALPDDEAILALLDHVGRDPQPS